MPKIWREGMKVEYLGDSKIRWTCPSGHVTTEIFKVGPKGFKRPCYPGMVKKMVKYWQDRVTYKCRKCKA
jgi:hypothetical protein